MYSLPACPLKWVNVISRFMEFLYLVYRRLQTFITLSKQNETGTIHFSIKVKIINVHKLYYSILRSAYDYSRYRQTMKLILSNYEV